MRVKALLFARLRDVAGVSEWTCDISKKATVADVPMLLGADVKYGAASERLIVKIYPTARQSHVPSPLLAAGFSGSLVTTKLNTRSASATLPFSK